MSLFRRKKKKDEVIDKKLTSEKIIYDQLEEAKDQLLNRLATNIINGNPVILNMELLDIYSANKVIAFLSGAVYACEGYVHQISETNFLFGNSEVYIDGSVKKLLESI